MVLVNMMANGNINDMKLVSALNVGKMGKQRSLLGVLPDDDDDEDLKIPTL